MRRRNQKEKKEEKIFELPINLEELTKEGDDDDTLKQAVEVTKEKKYTSILDFLLFDNN